MSDDATEEEESTELVVVFPRGELSYQGMVVEVDALIAKAATLVVSTPIEAKIATDHLGAIDERHKFIESSRNEYLAPLRQHT
ncbi:hypothetical protein LCGC14_1421430, partial [marine sediment metagenome]